MAEDKEKEIGKLWVRKSSASTNNNASWLDYSLNNPDTLTKYKTAAEISHKALKAVTGEEDHAVSA